MGRSPQTFRCSMNLSWLDVYLSRLRQADKDKNHVALLMWASCIATMARSRCTPEELRAYDELCAKHLARALDLESPRL